MKTRVLMTAFCAVLSFAACSSNNDPLEDAEKSIAKDAHLIVGTRTNGNVDLPLSFRFNNDGLLIVDNAQIPSRTAFDMEIDGHAWRMVSQGFILPNGTIKDNNKGGRVECIILLQHDKLAILSNDSFAPNENLFTYLSMTDYDDQTGCIGLFNILKLSADGSQITTVSETWWYPDPNGKYEKGYSVEVYERLSDAEKNQAIAKYNVDFDKYIATTPFEASNGKDVFGAKLSELSFSYTELGELRVSGLKQISESVFRQYIAGYGWKCESEHQIEIDGTVNKNEYEYDVKVENKTHLYFGDDTYQVFSTSYYHNNTPWYYEEKYVYDETTNRFYEINGEELVDGCQIICLDNNSFYMIRMNMQNRYSSDSRAYRYNLVKYTRLTEQELQDLRAKHSTNFWDLNWGTGN